MKTVATAVAAGVLLAASNGLAEPSGVYCADGGDSFLVSRPAGGADIEIVVSTWRGTFNCAAAGVARLLPDGWLLQDQGCNIVLREQNGAVVVSATPHGACEAFCGASASLNGLTFPEAGHVSEVAPPDLYQMNAGALDPC